MSTKVTWKDKLLAAFFARDEEGLKKALETKDEEGAGDATHIHVHNTAADAGGKEFVTKDEFESHAEKNDAEHKSFRDDIEALRKEMSEKKETKDEKENDKDEKDTKDAEDPDDGDLEAEAPDGTNDVKLKDTKDSGLLADSYRETIAVAEILAPGIRVFTFDHSAPPTLSIKRLCGLRRDALDLAYAQPATRAMIADVLGGRTLDTKKMTCDAVRNVFRAVGAMKKASNVKDAQGKDHLSGAGVAVSSGGMKSVRDINKAWEESHKSN